MHPGQPITVAEHIASERLAWTLVERIQHLLRPDDIDACHRQFVIDIRAHLKEERKNGHA